MKIRLRKCKYDRHASLVLERDYGKYHSPDPYQNCKRGVAVKTVLGLKDRLCQGTHTKSGILEIIRSLYADLLRRKDLMNLAEEITVNEVTRAFE